MLPLQVAPLLDSKDRRNGVVTVEGWGTIRARSLSLEAHAVDVDKWGRIDIDAQGLSQGTGAGGGSAGGGHGGRGGLGAASKSWGD